MPSPDASVRRFGAAITHLSEDDQTLSVQNFTIDHVGSAATTLDGAQGVFLQVGSEVVQATYLDSLTSPAAGQTVRVLIVDKSPTILGRVVGRPVV